MFWGWMLAIRPFIYDLSCEYLSLLGLLVLRAFRVCCICSMLALRYLPSKLLDLGPQFCHGLPLCFAGRGIVPALQCSCYSCWVALSQVECTGAVSCVFPQFLACASRRGLGLLSHPLPGP